jgi:hypothetical protein
MMWETYLHPSLPTTINTDHSSLQTQHKGLTLPQSNVILRCITNSLIHSLYNFGWKDGNAGTSRSHQNTRRHEKGSTNQVGNKDSDCNGDTSAHIQSILQTCHDLVESRSNGDRHGDTERSNDIVKDIKASVNCQEWLPRSGCKWTLASLKTKASVNSE